MKTLTAILSAALIAGMSTVAMAQGAGTGGSAGADGGAGGDVNPNRMGKGSDANPSSPGANPAAGTREAVTPGAGSGTPSGAMKTAPVSGVPESKGNSSSTPSGAPTGTSK